MSQGIHISIDAMGGDNDPRLCVAATLDYLRRNHDVRVTFFGYRAEIDKLLAQSNHLTSQIAGRIQVINAEQIVFMEDKPGVALKHKRKSSMWLSLALLAEGQADACVSSGNTGALMAMSRHLVGTFPGMSRPAICKPIPTAQGTSYLLDLGANLNCSSEQLVQFAVMGTALANVMGRPQPKVALLNVGTETTKGNNDIQLTAELMRGNANLNFCGFIEGDDLYRGHVDVVVCDGFIGNVALKVSEGVAKFIFGSLQQTLTRNPFNRCVALLLRPFLKSWFDQFSPERYNGAALLGLKKIVIKGHGGAGMLGFQRALETAKEQIQAKIPQKIEMCLPSI